MFVGFPSTQTPAVQWWDYSKTSTGTINIALQNDCAPIQFFATGASTTTIQVTLPPNPVSGKTIIFKNERYRASTQSIQINDPFPQGLTAPCILGQGGSVTFCYIAQNTLTGTGSANWVIISGGSGIAPLNYYSASLSGYQNNAIGLYAVVAGGQGNTSSGTNTIVCGGSNNTAASSNTVVAGGDNNTASGDTATISGGQSNSASGTRSIVAGGNTNTSNAQESAVIGGARGITRSIVGNFVTPASNTPITTTQGVSQSALLVLGVATTDATATILRSNGSAASTTNQVILPNNSAYVFQGTCIANVTGGSTTSGWKFEGVIKRGANAASTALVAAVTPTVIAQDLAAATWVLAIYPQTQQMAA